MMTAGSISSHSSTAYAGYLDAKAIAPERGDYYLGRDGLPAEAPGRWHAPAAALTALGVDPEAPVQRGALEALMEGRAPGSTREQPVWLRRAGADGTRAAGLDVTFSAPKSVSIAWALSSGGQREALEAAHRGAVAEALGYLRETVPTLAVYQGRGLPRLEVPAAGLLAAEFVHTTARGVEDGVPDPQLHSHCVITSVLRADGSVAAARSRPVFRAAREVGAFYRACLAEQLTELGYEIEHSTGKDGRYFELQGVGEQARAAFSKRSQEVARAAERFRAQYGRAPERGELRALKLASRQAKQPRTRPELTQAWRDTAAHVGLGDPERIAELANRQSSGPGDREQWRADVERGLTQARATFTERELRATALEQAPGRYAASDAIKQIRGLRERGQVLSLEGDLLTTARVRAQEQRAVDALARLAETETVQISQRHRSAGAAAVHERLGAPLSQEQLDALTVLTGPERAAVLIGPAGTGKGVVIDALARAERLAGRRVIGVAVAGSTAERLGHDSPALRYASVNVDALLARVQAGQLPIDARTTVIFDEAGMADTDRLQRLTTAVEDAGSKLVLVGDAHQLASIGPGGLFARTSRLAPTAELSEVRRTQDQAEQQAWRQLRAGQPDLAMAHYRARGQLHIADTRDEALEAAVRRYDKLAQQHGVEQVALMTDGPNLEVDRMNARAQRLRAERGQLGPEQVELPELPYGLRAGDRITWTKPQSVRGQARVENGTRGNIIAVNAPERRVLVRLDGTERDIEVDKNAIGALRLAYAQHLYRQQGATVKRAVSLTGGWQTTREGAYVQASRARDGTDWHVSRDDLGIDGDDTDRIDRLAAAMRTPGTQTPSINFAIENQITIDEINRGLHVPHSPGTPRPRRPTIHHELEAQRGR